MDYETLKAEQFMQSDDEITILKITTDGHCGIHTHDFTEIAYIASGRGTHMVGGETDVIEKGDLFIMNAYVPHEYRSEPGAPLTVYNCIFHPESIDNSLGGCKDFVDVAYHYLFHSFNSEIDPKNYIKLTGKKSSQIDGILKSMEDEYREKESGYMQMLRSDLIKLLISAFRIYVADTAQRQSQPILKKLVVDNVVSYMRENYAGEIRCEKLAERYYVSKSYLSKIFKEQTGLSIVQMIQKIRIEKAVELLCSTILPIEEIVGMVGYSDPKYFYQLFNKVVGVTPGRYRETAKIK